MSLVVGLGLNFFDFRRLKFSDCFRVFFFGFFGIFESNIPLLKEAAEATEAAVATEESLAFVFLINETCFVVLMITDDMLIYFYT